MIRNAWNAFSKEWNRFFFEPISPASIGLYRIAIGIVTFLSILGRYPFRETFYTDRGIISYATMSRLLPGNPILNFRWMPADDPALGLYFIALMTVVLLLTIGFRTRLCSVLAWLGIMSLMHRNSFIENAGDDLVRISLFFLAFSQAGSAYSVDRWLRRRSGKEGPELEPSVPWAQRMLQLQLAFLYIETASFKLYGRSWHDGTAMYYALNYLELKRFDFKYAFYHLWQIKLATWSVLVGEYSCGLLIWFRKLRYWILAGAFLLHEGINLTMQFPVFQYAMMANLILFVFPEDVEKLVTRIAAGVPRKGKTPAADLCLR